MDLLAYAVSQKLKRSEDRLLNYVASGKDVPVSVLDDSFGELIGPLEDNQSTLLVDDYTQMLERYVPVQYTKQPGSDAYEVSGKISDRLLEALELVHGLGHDAVISDLIEDSARSLTNSQSVSVSDLTLKQLSEQMAQIEESIPEMESVEDIDDEMIDEIYEEVESETQFEQPETVADEVVEEDFELDDSFGMDEEFIEEEIVEERIEDVPEDDSFVEDESFVETPEEILNEMSQEEYAQLEQEMMSESIRRVYTKLVNDLKAFGLDEALGLSI